MSEQDATLIIITVIYLLACAWIGFYAYTKTKTTADYLVAGRRAHPVVMALSYGATFISTSAIVGFGGAAANFGMGLLWLTFFNIFVGIFVAFVFFGKRTRRMGHNLDAHTFPEFLGRRYQSKFIQFFSALVIFLFMPVYASAVLRGAGTFIVKTFHMDQAITLTTALQMAMLVYTVLVALYVIAGGLKGVMWTDALQGGIMLAGMVILILYSYGRLGGVVAGHEALSRLPANLEANAVQAVENYNQKTGEQLTLASVTDMGLAAAALRDKLKPMSEEARKKYLAENPKEDQLLQKFGAIAATDPKGVTSMAVVARLQRGGWRGWTDMPAFNTPFWCFMVTTVILGVGIGVLAQPQLVVRFMTVKSNRELNRAVPTGGIFILMMTGVAFVVGALSNVYFFQHGGEIAMVRAGGDSDLVIPTFITSRCPRGSWRCLL